MVSFSRKIPKRKTILSLLLIVFFLLLICMALLLEGEAYYLFTKNTPLGALLYLSVMFKYFEEINASIILDISYLVVLGVMIGCVAVSIKQYKAIRILYAVCICDILFCLLFFFNIFGILGNIAIIVIANLAQVDKELQR